MTEELVTLESVPEEPTAKDTDDVLDAILGRISPVGEAKENLKILVYSEPGGRKTTFAGTAPDNLIVDVEKGLTSLKNHPDIVDLSRIQRLEYKSFFQFEQLIDRLQKHAAPLEWVKVLTIDSMSELHKRGLAEKTYREWEKSPIMRNRYIAETEEHTENNEQIRQYVSALRDLDRDIILTAHARSVQQKDKSLKIYPDFSEKLANTLAGIVDVVAFVEMKEIEGETHAVWHCESNGYILAKNRIGLPAEIVDPTWATLQEYFAKHNAAK